jgi:hypothetical protein
MDLGDENSLPNDEPEGLPAVKRKILIELPPDVVEILDELLAPGSPLVGPEEDLITQCLQGNQYWAHLRELKADLERKRRAGK